MIWLGDALLQNTSLTPTLPLSVLRSVCLSQGIVSFIAGGLGWGQGKPVLKGN